jgi:transcription termination factor 2
MSISRDTPNHETSLRRILKITWFFYVSNDDVLKRADIKSMETFISAARLRWYGHVVRMADTRLAKFLLDWKPNFWKRSRGSPRKSWKACVLDNAAKFAGVDNIDIGTVQAWVSKIIEC